MGGQDVIIRYLKKHKVSVPVADLAVLGLSRPRLFRELSALMVQGRIERVRRGVYRMARPAGAGDYWRAVQSAYPQGVVCLLSALAFHEITTQSPPVVWLALPKSAWRKAVDYPPLRIVHLSGEAFTAGIEFRKRCGVEMRVYSPAKTVVDCFKFRNRIGLDVAIEALREGWRERRFTLDELEAMARVCRVQAVMRPYIEALVTA